MILSISLLLGSFGISIFSTNIRHLELGFIGNLDQLETWNWAQESDLGTGIEVQDKGIGREEFFAPEIRILEQKLDSGIEERKRYHRNGQKIIETAEANAGSRKQ